MTRFESKGFEIIDEIYSDHEIESMIELISKTEENNETFRRSEDLFAIRQFIKNVPDVVELVFNKKLKSLIVNQFGNEYFVSKSIYFDKPGSSNWFVSYHQDLTISVNKKSDIAGYGPWTVKQDQFAVQPPQQILEDNFTIRIHLDKTTAENGALRVVSGSHKEGIVPVANLQKNSISETVCEVERGGVMLMRPLLMHASSRTKNEQRRRVIHIEFSRRELDGELEWSEKNIIVY